jgi:glycyl-tRNA synthetase beta chain
VRTLFVEIGSEEIPARFMEPAKEGFSKLLVESLTAARLSFGGVRVQGTPRRIAVFVEDLAEKQEETVTVKFGPPANRAYDESGSPTKAAVGFAKSQGAAVEDLARGVKDGVEFVTLERKEVGRPTREVLPDLLKDVITRIPFQKKMRWGRESFQFARPIQWLLVLFGNEAVSMELADVKSGSVTYGHRFLSEGALEIADPSEYLRILEANHIIVDEQKRLQVILDGIGRIEGETGGRALGDEDLIKEILYITEYPYPLKGSFDEAFLRIPKEVLVNVMKSHQRYIPIEDGKGALMPYFIFFANTVPVKDANVIKGNEKVLRARLADAQFFFEEDRKVRLEGRYDRLASIVFHVKLGTLREKTERVLAVSRVLSSMLGYGERGKIEQAVRIMKVDLLTHMVGEFPELQGTMGRIYAKLQGEDADVAHAIEDHYLPAGGSGALPGTELGAIVGIADKIDSLVSFYSVGITPTGNLDPFALRRQALGIIRVVIDRRFHIPMGDLIEKSYAFGEAIRGRQALEATEEGLLDFIVTRFKFFMLEENHNQDFVETVLPFVALDIYDGFLRLVALENQKSLADFERLMVGFRRVFNITKQLTGEMDVKPTLFTQQEERNLHDICEAKREPFFAFMGERRYDEALSILVGFKETVDNFFDKVFVMDKDEAIRTNRLALLKRVRDMFLTYGDFSKIRIE